MSLLSRKPEESVERLKNNFLKKKQHNFRNENPAGLYIRVSR